MSGTQVSSDSISSTSQAAEPAFGCTLGDGGRDAAWVRVAGELDGASAPQLAQMLGQATRRARTVVVDLRGLTGADNSGLAAIVEASSSARREGRRLVLVRAPAHVERLWAVGLLDSVESVDLAAGAPPILALLEIARKDRANTRRPVRGPRRVATLLGASQITRGVDALIARGTQHDFIDS
jgi:anti-anti-sigma factor